MVSAKPAVQRPDVVKKKVVVNSKPAVKIPDPAKKASSEKPNPVVRANPDRRPKIPAQASTGNIAKETAAKKSIKGPVSTLPPAVVQHPKDAALKQSQSKATGQPKKIEKKAQPATSPKARTLAPEKVDPAKVGKVLKPGTLAEDKQATIKKGETAKPGKTDKPAIKGQAKEKPTPPKVKANIAVGPDPKPPPGTSEFLSNLKTAVTEKLTGTLTKVATGVGGAIAKEVQTQGGQLLGKIQDQVVDGVQGVVQQAETKAVTLASDYAKTVVNGGLHAFKDTANSTLEAIGMHVPENEEDHTEVKPEVSGEDEEHDAGIHQEIGPDEVAPASTTSHVDAAGAHTDEHNDDEVHDDKHNENGDDTVHVVEQNEVKASGETHIAPPEPPSTAGNGNADPSTIPSRGVSQKEEPKNGFWITFHLEHDDIVSAKWKQQEFEEAENGEKYYRVKCLYSDTKDFKTSDSTDLFISDQYYEKDQAGNIQAFEDHVHEFEKVPSNTRQVWKELNELFHFGMDDVSTRRFLVYHPPTLKPAEGCFVQTKAMAELHTALSDEAADLASILPTTSTTSQQRISSALIARGDGLRKLNEAEDWALTQEELTNRNEEDEVPVWEAHMKQLLDSYAGDESAGVFQEEAELRAERETLLTIVAPPVEEKAAAEEEEDAEHAEEE
ncbi:nucleolar and coiled-body phosphoprotein 1 [Xylographa trunciseda]|nr:nucleolar and coiled-body phosphoprotein 1 [Xylographa trunciseda]